MVSLVAGHVEAAARRAVEAELAEQRTGVSDQQWWSAHAPVLSRVMDARHHPTAAKAGRAAGEEYGAATHPERAFEFGLARIPDGVEMLIQQRCSQADS